MNSCEADPISSNTQRLPLVSNVDFKKIVERARRLSCRSADAILAVEPVWAGIAVAIVITLLLMGMSHSWIGLVMALVPYAARYSRRGYISCRTPFDLPIVVFLVAALVGVIASRDLKLSLGALETCIVGALFYYSLVNYTHPHLMLKVFLVVASCVVLLLSTWAAVGVISSMDGTEPLYPVLSRATVITDYVPPVPHAAVNMDGFSLVVHGLLLAILIVWAVLFGVVLFSRKPSLDLLVGPICVLLLGLGILSIGEGLWRFLDGTTLSRRIDLWVEAFAMLEPNLWTGIGLGNYNLVIDEWYITHPHNSYLELYINYGAIGVAAGLLAFIVLTRLGWGILRSSWKHPWFGYGFGILLAIVVAAIMGIFESAPMAIPSLGANEYYYAMSPVPWLLGGVLVMVHRLICNPASRDGSGSITFLGEQEISNRLLS
ncbi:MAG: hypothetical protein SVY53_02080 [Chloroflexota bacterium]|nr:hypothetical protein [Chloroflexota bacterium]